MQGGFPEASQSRCCGAFLETLPPQLGCAYAGTLIKGDMFGVGLVDEKNREKMLAPFTEMGQVFAQSGCFEKIAVDAFSAPEYMPKKQIRTYNLFGKHISRFFMGHIAKKLGARKSWMPGRLKTECRICENPCESANVNLCCLRQRHLGDTMRASKTRRHSYAE